MAGKKQHYIPQCLLREFSARRSGEKHYVYAFRKNQASFLSPTEDVAVQRYFYSEPSPDDTKTLDDKITDFENTLAPLLVKLRSTPDNQEFSSGLAINVIVHLAIRNAHIRDVFRVAIDSFVSSMQDVMTKEDALRDFLGIDNDQPSSILQDEIERAVDTVHSSLPADIPKPLLTRVFHVYVRERFADLYSQQTDFISEGFNFLASNVQKIVRNAHTSALERSLTPEERCTKIAHLHWRLQTLTAESLILPDCVVLAKGKDSELLHPYTINELNEIEEVFFPISPQKLVIGSTSGKLTFSVHEFNRMAASCCSTFFVSNTTSKEHEFLAQSIGKYTAVTILPLATEAIEELRAGLRTPTKNQITDIDDKCPRVPQSIPVTFPIGTDQDQAKAIAEVISTVALEASRTFPLTRLGSIAFVNTNHDSPSSQEVNEEAVFVNRGISAIHVGEDALPYFFLDGDTPEIRVVLHIETAHALHSFKFDDAISNSALYVSMFQLAFAGHRERLYEAFPTIFTTPLSDPWNDAIFVYIERFIGAYVSSVFSAHITPSAGEGLAGRLLAMLERAQVQITKERLAYRAHGNLDDFLRSTLDYIGAILWYAARLLGHYHGIEQSPFDGNAALQAKLKEMDLLHWVKVFEDDLRKAGDGHGKWTSTDGILSLGVHIERLLWPFAVLPWRNEKGELQVLIPPGIDAAAIAKLNNK